MKKFMTIIGALVALVFLVSGCGPKQEAQPPAGSPAAGGVNNTAVDCPDSWAMTANTPANNNWVSNGVPAIQQATNKTQARDAANQWLELVKTNSGLLVGASAYLLDKKVDPATLVAGGGCASAAATSLTQELGVALALADVKPAQAPTNATNTGTQKGQVVAYRNAGIGGNRKSILITLKNGNKVWILARCGNAVRNVFQPFIPKAPLSWECQQNWHPGCPGTGKWRQPPQGNGTSGVNTGGTPGAPSRPNHPPVNSGGGSGHPAPPPRPGGYDSGGGAGGAPGGSTTDGGGTTNNTGGGTPVNQGGGNNGGEIPHP